MADLKKLLWIAWLCTALVVSVAGCGEAVPPEVIFIRMDEVNDFEDIVGSSGVPPGHPPVWIHRDGSFIISYDDRNRMRDRYPDIKYSFVSDMPDHLRAAVPLRDEK